MSSRRWWGVAAAVGLLVAIGAPGLWYAQRPAGTVNAAVAEALAAATPAPTAGPAAEPAPVPPDDGRLGAGRAAAPAPPVEVRLPTLGVAAAVRPVGVARDGELAVPADVRTVGWYRHGPRPGDTRGSTVLGGHLDSAEQGRGAFFRLGELGPGDPVLVRLADRQVRRYRVVARERWAKADTPLDRLFARTGAPRLTLVTCGGGFREDAGSYTANVAVTAVPEGGE
jgi:hypothetical protein